MALIPELLQEFEVELADVLIGRVGRPRRHRAIRVRSNLPVTRDKVICDLSSTLKQISAGAQKRARNISVVRALALSALSLEYCLMQASGVDTNRHLSTFR